MRTVLVAGRGAAVTAVISAVSALPGVGTVRQVGEIDIHNTTRQFAGADILIEMVGGVTPAFAVAMAALGSGMACITANPLLVATHGRVLHNAANGQQAYFGFQAAGFGVPVGELMAAARPHKASVSFVSAASMALTRMAFRNESLGTVSAHFKMQKLDLSDWGGKVTQARAMALRSLWFKDDLRGAQINRVGVEQVEPTDVRRLRNFGLQPVFGAEITEHGLYTGPLAVASGSPLIQGNAQDVLVAETGHGEMVLMHSADETERMVSGVVADMRQYLRSAKPALITEVRNYGAAVHRDAVRAYVRIPYTEREQILAAKPEVMQERTDGDGLWQAVVAVESLDDLRIGAFGGVVYPLNGSWQAPAASALRLVG